MTTSPWFAAKLVKVEAATGSALPPPQQGPPPRMATLCWYDRERPALPTAADGDPCLGSGLTAKPLGALVAQVNGQSVSVGNGLSVGCCLYFGTAALPKTFAQLQPGDVPRWNGSAAGYQLSALDRISLIYEA